MSKLQDIRKKSGLTQEEIAKKLGISQQAYGNYERDGGSIPDKVLTKICEILMIDEETLRFDSKIENDSITEFLYKSLTAFHSTRNAVQLLEENGFVRLSENESWKLKEGGKYFVTKNNSAVIAFRINSLSNYAFNIASCHTDSPSLKIKGNSLLKSAEGYRLNVERYGGLINYTFMDIPLKVAGRVFVEKENSIEERIINSEFNVNIPSLCIHHNPSVNQGVELTNQNDMLPLIGRCNDLYKALLPEEKIINSDLYCIPFVKPTFTGSENEFLASPRIDNLSSLYSIIKAIISEEGKGVSVLYATDNEEIGSLTKQGAESILLTNVLRRINESLGKNNDDYHKAITNGFLLSIDNGHAIHPAHPEKNDPEQITRLNSGVVIKHHPNYSTDGLSSSVVELIAKKNDIDIQHYYNKSDLRCGTTIGNVASAQLAINSCDIGLAQLAMHSGIETVGKYDIIKMEKLVKAFYETSLEVSTNKIEIK